MPSFYSSLHRQASLVFPPVGFVLNILLLFLIWFRTPREMWTQCRILVQTCLFDCLFLTVITVAAPVPLANYEASLAIYTFRGYFPAQLRSLFHYLSDYYYNLNELTTFDSYDYRVLHFHVNLYTALYYFDIFSVCIQVVYRHLCHNLHTSIKLSHYMLLLAMAIGIDVLQQLLFASYAAVIQCLPTDNCPQTIKAAVGNNDDSVTGVTLVLTVMSDGFSQVLQFSWVVLVAVTYAIIWYCTREMIKYVNFHANLNSNLITLNLQLTNTLTILAALHFSLICLNLLVTTLVAITENPLLNLKYLVSTLMLSLPMLNPVVCILANRPYRDAVLKWIFGCFKINSSTI